MRMSAYGFALGFCAVYMAFFAFEIPFLLYYPLTGEWSFQILDGDHGPAMQWFGMLVGGGIGGAITALALNDSWLPDGVKRLVLPLVVTAMLGCVFLLRGLLWA